MFSSSTKGALPEINHVPKHIAIIMDGNGRWAKRRLLPRVAGHKRGLDAVRETVRACQTLGVGYLTLFAFSTENWRRPRDEVSFLMNLFLLALEQEVKRLSENNIRLRVIGSRERFSQELVERVVAAEERTQTNTGLNLTVAADYGGRWDIIQAVNCLLHEGATQIDEAQVMPYLSNSWAPEPDLFIRTGGEQRVSNFMLWQMAYSELYFTDTLWPDFNSDALNEAIEFYQQRERRFGRTSEQLPEHLRRNDP